MGLDMYLSARRFFWFNEPKPVVEGHEVKEVIVEAGYWRKANQIHGWFVDNVQDGEDDCKPYYVPREKLQELLEICLKRDPELLPPTAGFFFGSIEVDEYYWQDIDHTIETLNRALQSFPEDKWDFEYRSSW